MKKDNLVNRIFKKAKNTMHSDKESLDFILQKYALFSKSQKNKICNEILPNEFANKKDGTDNAGNVSIKSSYSLTPSNIFEDGKKHFIKDIIKKGLNDDPTEKKYTPKTLSRKFRRRLSKLSREFSVSDEVRRLSVGKRKKRSKKKKNVFFNTSYTLPWTDGSLWTTISRTLPESLPNSKPKTSRREVSERDAEACEAYLSPVGNIGSSWLAIFTKFATSCAMDLEYLDYSQRNRCSVLSVSDAVELTSKNTNSGLPFSIKKNSDKAKSWTKNALRNLLKRPCYGEIVTAFTNGLVLSKKGTMQALFELPALTYHRFQIGRNEDNSPKVKIRQVWCVPQLLVALEAYFFYNILEICKNKSVSKPDYKYSICQNNRLISKRICLLKKVRRTSLNGKYSFYSLDYAKYDRSIPVWFVDIFYAIAEECIADMSKHEKLLYNMLRLFTKYTPFIYDGEIFFKIRGISSGLFITNFYDTLFNMTLIKITEYLFFEKESYCDYIMKSDHNFLLRRTAFSKSIDPSYIDWKFDCIFLGDDGVVYWCDRMLKLLEKICYFLGMEVSVKNISRSEDEDIFYLGRSWDYNNIPDQTFEYITDHIIFRTKFYNENDLDFSLEDLDVMRVFSICLPLKSGKEYLNKVFKDWEPLKKFYEEKKTLHLMTGIFYEGKKSFKFDEIPTNPLDF